jgi:hypothetical protein
MLKSCAGLLAALCILSGCAAPPQPAGTHSAATQSAIKPGTDSGPAQPDANYRTIFVPPQAGSLLGGGSVRVPIDVKGNDETALVSTINRLDAAAGDKTERPFVITSVARATGVNERELQAQHDLLQLRFGELCAINAIARGNSDKVHEIAVLKSKGRTWTQLANANGLSISTVVQTTRNASELTATAYTNSAERAKGGTEKLKSIGVHPQNAPAPGN